MRVRKMTALMLAGAMTASVFAAPLAVKAESILLSLVRITPI